HPLRPARHDRPVRGSCPPIEYRIPANRPPSKAGRSYRACGSEVPLIDRPPYHARHSSGTEAAVAAIKSNGTYILDATDTNARVDSLDGAEHVKRSRRPTLSRRRSGPAVPRGSPLAGWPDLPALRLGRQRVQDEEDRGLSLRRA